jgi:hypothetical protein
MSLREALRIAEALRDNYNLKASTPLDVGLAVGIAPTSGGFRTLAGASIAFGLTTGGYNAAEIALTDLGERIVSPKEEGDDAVALIEAFERPRLSKEFLAKYNGGRLPARNVVENVLRGMGVAFENAPRVYDLLHQGLEELGYLKDINGNKFVQRPPGATAAQTPDFDGDDGDLAEGGSTGETEGRGRADPAPPATPPAIPSRPNAIFLGHGKNKKPLEQLIRVLDEYGIPHKEATGEANAGRPIPVKVAETMRECGAAILIFTADEHFFDHDQNEVWRPSENVVHELGAASVLYENRIIIFKEQGVDLASNFSSIGYISFEKDKLSDKGIELFRELVKFKIVSISVGS